MNESIAQIFEQVGQGEIELLSDAEKLIFYREILNQIKAMVYINQVDWTNDQPTTRIVWSNEQTNQFTGFSSEEMIQAGPQFWESIMKPEDHRVPRESPETMKLKEGDTVWGLTHKRTRYGEKIWVYGNSLVIGLKDGRPWQFLHTSINIQNEVDIPQQLAELFRENNKLKHKIALSGISNREKEVIVMISQGKKDKEIAAELKISPQTAKKHRNNLLKKLHKRNTAELAVFAAENGLIGS